MVGHLTRTTGQVPIGRFFDSAKIPSHSALRAKKQHIYQKTEQKSPGGIEPTTTKTATTDNQGQ